MYIYRQNITIFISSILAIYYIRHNMFRPLMLVIFRLYMDLLSSYATYVGCFGDIFTYYIDLVILIKQKG